MAIVALSPETDEFVSAPRLPGRPMRRYRSLISEGICEPLSTVIFHGDAPLDRRLMCGQGIHPQANQHVAVHQIRGVPQSLDRSYCQPHTHNCPELNLLFSFERMRFRITLGDEWYICRAPCSIFIPAGISHSANVIDGTGFFVVILGCGDYLQSVISDEIAP